MVQAQWNGTVLADANDVALVEGNVYFHRRDVNTNYLRDSLERRTYCHWKGFADYYDIVIYDSINVGSAWYYAFPYEASTVIKDRIAFWRGVVINGAPEGKGLVDSRPSLRGSLTGWKALCWLLSNTEKHSLTIAEITRHTDIAPMRFIEAWDTFDVNRYAAHYNWTLINEGGEFHLEKGN